MNIKELTQKSNFVQDIYSKTAKAINPDIKDLWYVHDSITNEEWIIIEYKNNYKKRICVTCDSLKAIVWDTVTKL